MNGIPAITIMPGDRVNHRRPDGKAEEKTVLSVGLDYVKIRSAGQVIRVPESALLSVIRCGR